MKIYPDESELTKVGILGELNPCGILENRDTHCKYMHECYEIGLKGNIFICMSHTAFQLVNYINYKDKFIRYIKDSSVAIKSCSEESLNIFMKNSIGKFLVDPRKDKWDPILMQDQDVTQVLQDIQIRGKEILDELIKKYNKGIN